MAGVDFEVLRNKIRMSQVLEQLHFELVAQTGDQLRGPCPVHRSSNPSSRTFSVNLDTGRYCCHKCKSKGNQLELWAAVHGLSIYEAAIDLCRALARPVPRIDRW